VRTYHAVTKLKKRESLPLRRSLLPQRDAATGWGFERRRVRTGSAVVKRS